MLQTSRTENWVNRDVASSEPRAPTDSLSEAIAFLRRHLSIISLACLATLAVALTYIVVAVPTFTATAEILIAAKSGPTDATAVSAIVESQIALLRSEGIARDVIRKLDLTNDPEYARQDLLHRIASPLSRLLGWSKAETEDSTVRRAVESLERKLSVKRVGQAFMVDVAFDATNPERAAKIVNAFAEAYIAAQMDAKYRTNLLDETWIKDRLTELSDRASAAQKALEDYKSKIDTSNSAAPNAERTLAAAVESSRDAYENFRHVLRQTEAAQQQSTPVSEASLVTRASPPLRASSPKVGIVLGISLLGGAILGVGLGMLRDASSHGAHTSGQVSKALQTACIAVVPAARSGRSRGATTFPDSPDPGSPPPKTRNLVHGDMPIWTITDAPHSRFAESFLEIKLAIDCINRNGKRNQLIGITSAYPQEGKSTVAAALALQIARTGARVILVDCNFRNPSLSAALAPAAEFGALDVVSGAAALRGITWIDSTTHLAFLPLGTQLVSIHPNAPTASDLLNKLAQPLREAYEYVIVDLPAVAPFADVPAAVGALDSSIFIMEKSRTNMDVVKRAMEIIQYENVLGIVVNNPKRSSLWTTLAGV